MCKFALFDLACELCCPSFGQWVRLSMQATKGFFGDRAVPNVVKIVLPTLPQYVNAVTASSHVFIVQGLV